MLYFRKSALSVSISVDKASLICYILAWELVYGKTENLFGKLSVSHCVISNMMNAAWALGIGSCWIHRAKEEMESDFGKKLFASLGIEGEYIGVGHVALGYIDGEIPEAKPRKAHRVYFAD